MYLNYLHDYVQSEQPLYGRIDLTTNGNYISIPDFSPLTTDSMVYRSSRIKLSSGQLYWREVGSSNRPVLIFLHGSWHDGSQWQELMEPLSQNFHCFALDLLGYGNSIAIQPPTSIAAQVDCLAEFVDTLKLSPVYLIGHSLGGWIAISYSLNSPDLVRGVVAISPEGFSLASWYQYSRFTQYLLAHPFLLKLWLAGLKVLSSLSDGATRLEKMRTYWQFFQKFPTTCRLLFGRSTNTIRSELVRDRLAQFRPPLLIFNNDAPVDKSHQRDTFVPRSIRQAEYQSMDNRSLPQIAPEIAEFLGRVEQKIDREEFELW